MKSDPAEDPKITLIRAAAGGDKQAVRQLVTELTPVIRCSVALALSRGSGRREARQELEDVTQSVLLTLFSDGARSLLLWSPSRGLDLDSYVGLLAKNETASLLRSRRRNPWTEDPTLHEELDLNEVRRMGPESETISRDMLAALDARLRARLTARGLEIFNLMFVKSLPVEEVSATTGLSAEAIYAWKSRLTRQVKEILDDLADLPPPSSRISDPGAPPSGPPSAPPSAVQRRGRKEPL